jgi:hypothetical protein
MTASISETLTKAFVIISIRVDSKEFFSKCFHFLLKALNGYIAIRMSAAEAFYFDPVLNQRQGNHAGHGHFAAPRGSARVTGPLIGSMKVPRHISQICEALVFDDQWSKLLSDTEGKICILEQPNTKWFLQRFFRMSSFHGSDSYPS